VKRWAVLDGINGSPITSMAQMMCFYECCVEEKCPWLDFTFKEGHQQHIVLETAQCAEADAKVCEMHKISSLASENVHHAAALLREVQEFTIAESSWASEPPTAATQTQVVIPQQRKRKVPPPSAEKQDDKRRPKSADTAGAQAGTRSQVVGKATRQNHRRDAALELAKRKPAIAQGKPRTRATRSCASQHKFKKGSEEHKASLVGHPVRKRFKSLGWYEGTVNAYDRHNDWFKVRYKDGDMEEVEFKELVSILDSS